MKTNFSLSFIWIFILFISSNAVGRVEVVNWVNFAKYAASNQSILEDAGAPQMIVLMGDSITENWNLSQLPHQDEVQWINRGISAQTSSQMLLRFRPDVVELKPDVVVILAGTNDIAGNSGNVPLKIIQTNIQTMADVAIAHEITPVLCSLPPVTSFYWRDDIRPMHHIGQLNQWIEQYAAHHGFVFVDYHSTLIGNDGAMGEGFSGDGVHPNIDGYSKMKTKLIEGLEKIETLKF